MPQVTRHTVRQPPQRPWRSGVQFLLNHASALALVGGAVAYLVGYLLVLDLADALGVAPSVFGLDFRDFVLLSLSNLLLFLLAGIALIGSYALHARVLPQPTNPRETRSEIDTVLLIGGLDLVPIAAAAWLMTTWPFTATANTSIMAVLLGFSTGAVTFMSKWVWTRSVANPAPWEHRVLVVFRWVFLVGVTIVLVSVTALVLRGLPSIAVSESAASLVDGRPTLTGTSLDIVIRPTLARVQQPDGSDVLSSTDIPAGSEVVLITDRGGTATVVYDGDVYVMRSEDLTFVSTPKP